MIWENNGSQPGDLVRPTPAAIDTMDFDDGNTTEAIASASISFTYISPMEIYSTKSVR